MNTQIWVLVAISFLWLTAVFGCGSALGKKEAGLNSQSANKNETSIGKVKTDALVPPPLPILSPTALTGDAGDGRAFLRWNLQLEDERVVGWNVMQTAPQQATLNAQPLTAPGFVARDLQNGTTYTFNVVGVLNDGTQTPASNAVTLTPRATGDAKVEPLAKDVKITIGQFDDVTITEGAARVIFPDGQEIIFDRGRPIDWKSRDGQHLIYPKHFGNGLDIGKFGDDGLPDIIPPGGIGAGKLPTTQRAHAPVPDALPHDYHDAQFGTDHPYITDPMTLPLDEQHHDAPPSWKEPTIDGDRVTFHWWQPITAMHFRSWTYVQVWETWWPIERERHGTTYHGFARLIEVEMPSALKDGYQVMLNDGFGPNGGSRKGVVSYSSGFRNPGVEIVDFSGDTNQSVIFQQPKPPRRGYGYHPNQDCLQSHPMIFYEWEKGSMTIAARSLYYHCANNSSSYIEQKADGVWPNLAWDLAIAGKRTAVDTVEYLYTNETKQALPQRYINARTEAYTEVSRRMGVQETLAGVSMYASMGELKRDGGPVAHAEKKLPFLKEKAHDAYGIYHDTWQAVPYTVDAQYRLDENYDINAQLKAMCDRLRGEGYKVGFWFRPDFTKTSIVNILSDKMPTAEMYYGYKFCEWPDASTLLHERGIPVIRDNTNWIRRRKDGSFPYNTPYQWTPMSMASGWWDQIMWPTLLTSSKMGFQFVLQDGGFGGMQGVDYSPRLDGKTDSAVAAQPYWWRMFRTMHYVGIDLIGECTVGWRGASTNIVGPGDENFLWMYHNGWVISDRTKTTPDRLHKLYQLYTTAHSDSQGEAVRRFARKFYEAHPAPDWMEFVDLKQGDPIEVTSKVGESPVAGMESSRTTENDTITITVRPWQWTDVVWHYNDGTQVVYPAYDKVNWDKE